MARYKFSDFTISNYSRLLALAKSTFKFVRFEDFIESEGPVIFWRHDVDVSVHRALILAQIEAKEKVRATYFVQLSSHFYSVFEEDIKRLLKQIEGLGHDIGLHFNPMSYEIRSEADLERYLYFERSVLENLLSTKVTIFSFHVPTVGTADFLQRQYAGMLNIYSPEFREKFRYCSDSNGYWRHEPLEDVLRETTGGRLQVLTHPEYWTDEILSAKQRIQRCIDGRAKSTLSRFESIVKATGRIVPDWSDESDR